jgi:prolyl-tRNA synthetase
MSTARRLHDDLEAEGIDVLLDDRDARPGHKFKDADLIGIPLRLTVGKRGLDTGVVELKVRSQSEVLKIPPGDALPQVKTAIDRLIPARRD